MIAQAAARLPLKVAGRITTDAMGFDDPAVLPLFDRFVKSPEERQSLKKEWHEKHDKAAASPDRQE